MIGWSNTERRKSCKEISAIIFFSCLSLRYLLGHVAGASDEYLYKNKEDFKFVIDYVKVDAEDRKEFMIDPENDGSPNFIASKENGNRVVEFYAPWCGHCRHFAPQYAKTAKESNMKNQDVKFYAVSCVAHHELCKKESIHGFPTIYLLKAGSIDKIKLKQNVVTPDGVMEEINMDPKVRARHEENLKDFVKPSLRSGVNVESEKKIAIKTSDKPYVMRKKDILNDAAASFIFNLRTGIFTSKGSLTSEQQAAFSAWLNLLRVTLPERSSLHTVINDILSNFSDAVKDEKYLLKILERNGMGVNLKWSHICQKNDESDGYTCGLWKLFHIMSIGLVERKKELHEEKDVISTADAGETLQKFIKHFFGCSVCVEHFLSMYESCGFDHCKTLTKTVQSTSSNYKSPKNFSIWLWQVHNSVNVRLFEEESNTKANEKTKSKYQWPSRKDCDVCWEAEDKFDREEVYLYLKKTYWHEDGWEIMNSQVVAKSNGTSFSIQRGFSLILSLLFLWILTFWCCNGKKFHSKRKM